MGVAEGTTKGIGAEHLEVVQDDLANGRPVHYQPIAEQERSLDKRVNLKLDLFVVTILALEFIVSIQALAVCCALL